MKQAPFILLCSGQSNMARVNPGHPWSPPDRLKVWDYSARFHGEAAGKEFKDPNPEAVNYGVLYGAEIARAHPSRDVYVINISRGATNLEQWLDTAASVNMWRAMLNNVSAAMEHITDKGVIDELIWWGHESDASDKADTSASQFIDMFTAIIARNDAQPWGRGGAYPIRLHRIHPDCNELADQINFALESLVRQDPSRLSLIDLTHFGFADNIHLDPADKPSAARFAYECARPGVSLEVPAPTPGHLLNGAFSHGASTFIGTLTKSSGRLHACWKASPVQGGYSVVNGTVTLCPSASLKQYIPGTSLTSQVVTLSMNEVSSDLVITAGNKTATMTAGPGRRQVSFRLSRRKKRKIAITLFNDSEIPVRFSEVKLESGGGHTAFSHTDADRAFANRYERGIIHRLMYRFSRR